MLGPVFRAEHLLLNQVSMYVLLFGPAWCSVVRIRNYTNVSSSDHNFRTEPNPNHGHSGDYLYAGSYEDAELPAVECLTPIYVPWLA